MSSDQFYKFEEINQRRTPFSSNLLIPDLNVFTEGPGVGKYSAKNIVGNCLIESNIENQPKFTIPKATRLIFKLNNETPGPSHYKINLKNEKIPGHYCLSRPNEVSSMFRNIIKIILISYFILLFLK